ncbi:MAG: CPBP family intramembrane metalloprotease [Bacilli bacterium]|nr:CPBP family intramembrane metalloprotease [Bacilli bacterium]
MEQNKEILRENKLFGKERPQLINMPIWRYILLIGLGYFGFNFIFSVAVQFLAIPVIFGSYSQEVLESISFMAANPAFATKDFYLLLLVTNFGGYLITTIALILSTLKEPLKDILSKYKNINTYIYGLSYGALILVLTVLYGLFSTAVSGSSESNANETMIQTLNSSYPLFIGIMTCIFAPIVEELTYRYGLFGLIAKKSRLAGYIISAIVFALLHFDFTATGSNLINELWNLPSYIISGVVLCYAYESTGNLGVSTFAHFVNNFTATVISYLVSTNLVGIF